MHLLYVGGILGVVTYISWMGYYWLYLPKKIRAWFEASLSRLFILDLALTVMGLIGFHGVSDSLTSVVAASTLGFLGTMTTIGIRVCQYIRATMRLSRSK